jgi:hypothetical protein
MFMIGICTAFAWFFFMFGWPCISNHICTINQHDALFVLTLLNNHTCTCFEHYLLVFSRCYINNNWYIACVLCRLAAIRVGVEWHLPHIHLLPPDDGPQTGTKHVQVWLFNKVRTNSASCWFIVQICFEMQGQPNIKKNQANAVQIPIINMYYRLHKSFI